MFVFFLGGGGCRTSCHIGRASESKTGESKNEGAFIFPLPSFSFARASNMAASSTLPTSFPLPSARQGSRQMRGGGGACQRP